MNAAHRKSSSQKAGILPVELLNFLRLNQRSNEALRYALALFNTLLDRGVDGTVDFHDTVVQLLSPRDFTVREPSEEW